MIRGKGLQGRIIVQRQGRSEDAVVQGLSEVPFMQDVERWGVLTIGTGLGNARFTNRRKDKDKDRSDKKDKDEKKDKDKKSKD